MRRSGRVRGRPRPPGRGTRIPAKTGSNWVLSWRCPGVITTESGRPLPSQARCTLLVSPPRLRPSPSSGGRWTRFCVGLTRLTPGTTSMLMGAGRRAIDTHLPDNLAHRIRAGLHVRQNAVPGPISPPTIQAVRARLPRPVALRQIAPGRYGPQFPQDTVNHCAMIPPLAATPARGQQPRDDTPRLFRYLPASNQLTTLFQSASSTRAAHPIRFVRQALIGCGGERDQDGGPWRGADRN